MKGPDFLPIKRLAALRNDVEALGINPDHFSDSELRYLLDHFFHGGKYLIGKDLNRGIDSLIKRRTEIFVKAPPLDKNARQFKETHDSIVTSAKARARSRRQEYLWPYEPNVTNFTEWVYSFYKKRESSRAQLLGKVAEGLIPVTPYIEKLLEEHHRVQQRAIKKALDRSLAKKKIPNTPYSEGWELICKNFGDDKYEDTRVIPQLSFNGQGTSGAPDLVYQHALTKEIVIIEVKTSNADVSHSDGWPNLRAQLWAYAQIADWQDAPKITLVGDVWGYQICSGIPVPYPKKRWVWDYADEIFKTQNLEIYCLYKALLKDKENAAD